MKNYNNRKKCPFAEIFMMFGRTGGAVCTERTLGCMLFGRRHVERHVVGFLRALIAH